MECGDRRDAAQLWRDDDALQVDGNQDQAIVLYMKLY